MPNWFRPGPPPHQTALAMIGAKSGDRVLMLGADDPDLAAALALVTGLNGQTLVVDERADAARDVEAAAAKAGALVDFDTSAMTTLTGVDSAHFDVAVVVSSLAGVAEDARVARVAEAVRAVRSGGRIVIIDGRKSSGMFAGFGRAAARVTPPAALGLLERAGLKAYRQLADVDGVAFYEGRKA